MCEREERQRVEQHAGRAATAPFPLVGQRVHVEIQPFEQVTQLQKQK